ncbi:MAG: hypothetical protein AAFZ18_30685, partial [Myxococcota bacterium]
MFSAASLRRLRSIVRETRSTAAGLALVPVGTVFRRFGRVTRDIERLTGKSIDLCLEGEDVELDKSVVDALYDPLLHLVRNSGDHGLEGPQEVKERVVEGVYDRLVELYVFAFEAQIDALSGESLD